MLKQGLQQKLSQKLSPLQIQIIKLLELPTIELEQRIKKEIDDNPALEVNYESEKDEQEDQNNDDSDNFSLDDYLNGNDIPSYKLLTKNYSVNDKHFDMPSVSGIDFKESLIIQLGLKDLNDEDINLAKYLIGSLDDDGFLRRELENIVDDLAFNANINTTEKHLEGLLKIIQSFDPAGVGARNLQECLLLQLKRKEDAHSKNNSLAITIVNDFFDAFTKKHYDKITKKLDISDEKLKEIVSIITKLNPKPGGAYSDPSVKIQQHIIPDFILENENGNLILSLNSSSIPELNVSRSYAEMLTDYSKNHKNISKDHKQAVSFIRQKLDSAKWFIDAIKQRQNTLLVTMNAIIEFQKKYFLTANESFLKPMILKDIAEITNLDISTISRVANSKYIQTDFGVFLLKTFFSEAMYTTDGEEISSRKIKAVIKDVIDSEDKKDPLTDDALTEELTKSGYKIARRTVSKYRIQLNIPVGRLRKEL